MSNDDRHGWSAGAGVNQFGTPVNQFGTPPAAAGSGGSTATGHHPGGFVGGSLGGPVNQFGNPAVLGATAAQWSAPAPRRSGGGWLVVVAVLAALVVAGVLGRVYVFPDLGKPIALPATVAGVSGASAASGQPVTVQSRDAEGRATAVSVYADDAIAPTTMVVVTAGRVKNLGTDRITESTSTSGKVTCTDNVATSALLAQAGAVAGPGAATLSRMTTGAACWRTGRHLTVMVVALTAHEAAQATARQAVSEAWAAI
ncbi:MAG TPA: hypothetical protein VFL94_10050 [Actinomycetales bacterium]|nr:hypothetical protein [Actinomycetales bacterium]